MCSFGTDCEDCDARPVSREDEPREDEPDDEQGPVAEKEVPPPPSPPPPSPSPSSPPIDCAATYGAHLQDCFGVSPTACACRTDDPNGPGGCATESGGGRRLLFATLQSSYEPKLPQARASEPYGVVAHCCCLAPETMTKKEREFLEKKVAQLQKKLEKCPGRKKCNKWESTVDTLTTALGNAVGGRCTQTKSTQWCATQAEKGKCKKWATWTKCMAACERC